MEPHLVFQQFVSSLSLPAGASLSEVDDQGLAHYTTPEGIIFHLQYTPSDRTCFIFTMLGEVPEEKSHNLLKYAMRSNLFWRQTQGATLAFEDANQTLVLQDLLPNHEMHQSHLITRLTEMTEVAVRWRGFLKAARQQIEADELGDDPETSPVVPFRAIAGPHTFA